MLMPRLGVLSAAAAMFGGLTVTNQGIAYRDDRRRLLYVKEHKPYFTPGQDAVLMDWDLPKGKRAKRRARGSAR